MTREQYDELSAPLVRTLLDMEDDILREIASQLAKDGNISDTSKWRIRQLARSGRFDKRAASIIAGYSGVQNGQAMDMVLEAARAEIGYLDNAVQAANAAGLSEYFSDIPAETSALNAAKAFQRQAASDLNLVNTVMKYKAGSAFVSAVNSVYRESQKGRQDVLDIMGKSSAKVVMGHMSLQEATRKTIRELARKGIPAFVDKSGREWSPEAYIMMDMRSTLANTARAAQDMRCDQYGIQLIEVSSHMGARPLCAPYQGRIFSRDGSKGITTDGAGGKIYYTPLSETSYGQPAGLFGINCGHVQYPFAPGINFQRYFPYPKEENDRRYRQFQQQRAMERDIRATKRECMMLQELDDKEGLQKASQRLRAQKEKYSAYCKDTGLGTHYDRTQVYGYDRSKSAKTVWAERKAKIQDNNRGTYGLFDTLINNKSIDKSLVRDIMKSDHKYYPDTLAGVKRGQLMSFYEANNKNVNPNYRKSKEYGINCQSCVLTMEARRRGYDVEALPFPSNEIQKLISKDARLAWVDARTGNHPEYFYNKKIKNVDDCLSWLDDIVKPGERYVFQHDTKGTLFDKHIVSLERDNITHELFFYDPQSGSILKGKQLVNYINRHVAFESSFIENAIYTNPQILRVDNMDFNVTAVNHVMRSKENA